MFDAGSRSEGPALCRAEGSVRVAVADRLGRSRLSQLYQKGSAKCLLPRGTPHPEAVLLNTAGGIAGGDRFDWAAEAGAGATLTVTTQAAERVYRSTGAEGRVTTRLALGAGAALDWLPQETILFDGGRLDRRLEIEMAGDARLTALEGLVLGRQSMGETVREGRFRDLWRVRRAGRLVFADALRLAGPVAGIAARPGTFGANRAAATLLHVAPDAASRLAPLRAALPGTGGASLLEDGVLVARLLAPTGAALRRALLAALAVLRPAPPRVWSF